VQLPACHIAAARRVAPAADGSPCLHSCLSTHLDPPRCVQAERLQAVTLDSTELHAYAGGARTLAARRVRPVSKQVNLGRKVVRRQGWGGGPAPLEVLARRLRAARAG
jgi:hypothetical protein